VQSFQARLEVEIRANGDLRSVVSSRRVEIEVLSRQLQEMEQARLRDKEYMEKKQAALEAKLERLLGPHEGMLYFPGTKHMLFC
jgi:hypothetical protein